MSDDGERLEWRLFPMGNFGSLSDEELDAWLLECPSDRFETDPEVPHAQIWRHALRVVLDAHVVLDVARSGQLDRFGDALVAFGDAQEDLRLSINHPHRTGWLREEDIIEGDSRAARREEIQIDANARAAEVSRARGLETRAAVERAIEDLRHQGRPADAAVIAGRIGKSVRTVRDHLRKIRQSS